MSEDFRLMMTLRFQAWNRAKGELNSLLDTYWTATGDGGYDELKIEINEFIKKIENKGMLE